MSVSKGRSLALSLAAAALLGAAPALAADLRIGLQDDADVLDPHQARTFVGRIVFTGLCDRLFAVKPDLSITGELVREWSWSPDNKQLTLKIREGASFHDGEKLDAKAVKYNLDRARTLKESRRKSEVASIESVDAVDDQTVRINLKSPDATLIAQLSDRAGMMVSPKAADAAGANFGLKPVCSGPYEFVERVQQDRIVLKRFAKHWNAAQHHFDRVIYMPIPDTTVRLANLQAGDLDLMERVAATDVKAVKGDSKLKFADATSLGYQGMTINLNNGKRSETPVGKDPRVRKALELAIDREALNQVVFEGNFVPGNQPWAPSNPFYAKSVPIPKRDVAKAKALLKEAGLDSIEVEVQVANNPVQLQMTQVVQAMAAEAGINLKLRATEFATLLKAQTAGDYQVSQIGWSGRVDPDGNIHQFMTCKGGINESKYCNQEVDALLDKARTSPELADRQKAYDEAMKILDRDRPIIYLYHPKWFWAMTAKLEGFQPNPEGMIRLEGLKLAK